MTNSDRRWIYFFGQGRADAGNEQKQLVGGKGASLGDMTRAGLRVPPGFTISAECCDLFYKNHNHWPEGLANEVRANLQRLEDLAARPFGRGANPLLVAVRSGAAQSMPGMMDTILNVGLNPDCIRAMAERTGNPHGAWQAYLHFQLMFARTVTDLPEAQLDGIVRDFLAAADKKAEDDLSPEQLEELCGMVAMTYHRHTGDNFPTEPWEILGAAIDAVFRSWMNDRAITYRDHHKITGLLGTAVNVQMMCPSEVSGVMFTGNPVDPRSEQMIVEASFGLGEAVVLGKVTPDRFVLDKRDARILERHIARKEKRVATLAADGQGQTGGAEDASLTDAQVEELGQLGLRVEAYFKHPCDLEWALSQGEFFLLQARAIKYKAAALIDPKEREQVRREEIERLRKMAEPGGTVWSRFNLSEILPDATPMTWSIVRRFMSGQGGFGLMYRDLGYQPDPALADECAFDLVAGRVYCNLSREPRMQFGAMPFEHDFASLKAEPSKAIYPQAVFNPRKASLGFWMKLPFLSVQQWWGESKRQGALRSFAAYFEQKVVPPYLREVEAAWQEDWSKLSPAQLLDKLDHWRRRTLDDFARESLKPTALAAILMAKIEGAFARRYQPPGTKPKEGEPTGADRAKVALRDLTMGVRPPAETDLGGAIEKLSSGELDRDQFLKAFGHRASAEMELAKPRWSEEHSHLDALTRSAHAAHGGDAFAAAWERIAKELRLAPFQIPMVERELRSLHRLFGLREAGKHHMLRGYALIRRALVELDQRFGLDGGIFYLTLDDLPPSSKVPIDVSGSSGFYKPLIAERRHRREVAMSLTLPQVLFSDDFEAIGREIEVDGTASFRGTPLSAGNAEATAWVLDDVAGATPPAEPYILVCPTTDPAWVPLFGRAKGLVMETGGVLSHGAIVAREFGLPAVAGIPDVHRRLQTGQRLFLDGGSGVVKVLG
jgi:pyruvate,water dikinase